MALKINNQSVVSNVKYNSQEVRILKYNGVVVWSNKEITYHFVMLTSNEYNLLTDKKNNTMYIIKE